MNKKEKTVLQNAGSEVRMDLSEYIGRYNVRKSLRFGLIPVAGTENFVYDAVYASEELAECLNPVKDVILAKHIAMVRRVFAQISDPLPGDPKAIVKAFRSDPEFSALDNPNAFTVLKSLVDSCRYNRWPVSPAVKNLLGWSALYMKWHWHCIAKRKVSATEGIPVEWAGKSKEEVLASFKWLRNQKPRKQSRNRWFDHAPFRLMFDNHSTGKSWLAGDFADSRNFLLKAGNRILVGVVPRDSKVDPFSMPLPRPDEEECLLYVENPGETPTFRAIPRTLVDAAANMGTLYLFELSGRAIRGSSNLNAKYLRTLLTSENFARGVLHLEKSCEFHFRKASIPNGKGAEEHFRQRFMEDKFFITLHITCNAHRVGAPEHVIPLRNAKKYMKKNALERYIQVSQTKDGYSVAAIRAFAENAFSPVTVSHKDAANGRLASELAKLSVEHGAHIILDKSVPSKIVTRVLRKFDYVVFKDRKAHEDGGILRGYQIKDRVLSGEKKSKVKVLSRNTEPNSPETSTSETQNSKPETNSQLTAPNSQLKTFTYIYMTPERVRSRAEIQAESKEDAYIQLRKKKIRPIRVLAEGESEPPPKDFMSKAAKREAKPEPSVADRLRRLNALKDEGLISEAEYAEQRAKIISAL